MEKIEGGCLCGNIRYTGETDVLMAVICHCKNCQIQSGSAFSTNIAVADNTIQLSGDVTLYEDKGDSGRRVNRYFCNQCGASVYSRAEALPGLTVIKVGTLDDSSWVKPSVEIYCDSAQDWLDLGKELKSIPGMMESA